MSIAELNLGAYGSPDGPELDRLPPQDVHAEQSVLGGMLLSKDAIAEAAERLKAEDFYRPAHEIIYGAIIDLFSRGEPVDAITVADEMTKRGTLQRVGGPAYLHDLIQSVPTAANVGYYATIVAERSLLRQLVEAGTRIVQLGYGQGEGEVDAIVNAAQAEIYKVGEKRRGDDYIPLAQTLEETLTEIEVASGRSDEFVGVPTGFTELDDLLHGLHKGQMIVVAARPAVGKALALDTPIPTPTGWTTMGALAVGDLVLDASGRPTRVVRATEVMVDRPCFEVVFSDGAVIVADGEHQWLTETCASGRAGGRAGGRVGGRVGGGASGSGPARVAVRTTEEIARTLRTPGRRSRLNHRVRMTFPLHLPEAVLPVAPYALGVWLAAGERAAGGSDGGGSDGGGSDGVGSDGVGSDGGEARVSLSDPELVMRLEAAGGLLTPAGDAARVRVELPRSVVGRGGVDEVGVIGDAPIPGAFLRASEFQRRELLAGLIDVAGTIAPDGDIELSIAHPRLFDSVGELLTSLGLVWRVSPLPALAGAAETSPGHAAYTLVVRTDEEVFRLSSKALLHKDRIARRPRPRTSRVITAVRRVPSVPVRCIEVDNADHLYLAGRAMIPTHNSTFGMDVARCAAIKHRMPTAIFSLEMSRTEISMRVIAAEGTIQLQDLRKGTIGDAGWAKIAKVVGRISDSPLFIDDSPNMSLMEIRAKCRRLKQQHQLQLVVIDYLQLMSSGKKVESRQQEVSEFSRALKLLAKELEVPVIAISQLNRGPEQRTDKRPQMSDLRESGSIEQDADVVILLHKDREREGEADVLVVKHRNGPTKDLVLGFQGHYARFANMAPNAGF